MKTLVLLFALLFACAGQAHAQSAAQMYQQGLTFAKKGKVQEAIAAFEASKKLNSSASNVKNCNAQISKLQRAGKDKAATTVKAEYYLTLSNTEVTFDTTPASDVVIDVRSIVERGRTEDNADWTVAMPTVDESWCSVQKQDGRSFAIKCKPNSLTIPRETNVTVKNDGLERIVHVVQAGHPVQLTVGAAEISAKKAKDSFHVVQVESNSDFLYDGEVKCPWYVEDMPDWCERIYDKSLIPKGTQMMSRLKNSITKSTQDLSFGIADPTELVVYVHPIPKTSSEFKSGRIGKIIIRSQDERREILVRQVK